MKSHIEETNNCMKENLPMSQTKSLTRVFKFVYPFLAVVICLTSAACIFDTFNLGLFEAFYNLLLLMPLFGISMVVFKKLYLASIASAMVVFFTYYIDEFVFAVRLTHIRYSDFSQVSQAVRVANRYKLIWSYEITRRLFIAVALCAFLFFVARYYKLTYSKLAVSLTGVGLILLGTLTFYMGILPHSPETFDFTSETEKNGLIYSWYCQYHESKLVEPRGYSKEKAHEILAAYTPTEGSSDINIIVIMNESLADYSLIGETPFDDPLPNIHGYEDNFFYGKLAVSVFGGGTCNTEYEFLTGNALAFLPEGATPYLQYVINKENSIVWDLKELGYKSTAIHPYYSEEWNRTQVYEFLGFDRFLSGIDFGNTVETNGKRATTSPGDNLISFGDGPLYVRGLISDQSSFERVLEETREHSFIFNVTMQNHGGYDYTGEDFSNTDYVTEADRRDAEGIPAIRRKRIVGINSQDRENEIYKVNQYLTCTNLSDKAVKQLTNQLEKTDIRTIILMFGDHQPALLIPEDFMDASGMTEAVYYDVPYMLWANFDIDFDAPQYTSPNYLSAILKKNSGLPLTAWDQFRLKMMEAYPVVTVDFILDAQYNAADRDVLTDYSIVQYMRMFD